MDIKYQWDLDENLKNEKKSFCKIDKQMLPYKLHFFLYIGALGAIIPYYPSIGITRLGLGAGNIAVVSTVQYFLTIVFKPLIGYTVDYFNNLKEMIVALTIIYGISSYLLLAIPIVSYNNFIRSNNKFQSHEERAQIIFCKFCSISDELKTMGENLPIATGEFQDEIFCAQENTVLESFAGNCPKIANSSVAVDIKVAIEIRTCYTSINKLKQLNNVDVNPPVNKSSKIFAKYFHNLISPELVMVCPYIQNVFEFHSTNFTLYDDIKACFKYTQDKIMSNNTITAETTEKISNNISCDEIGINKTANIMKSSSFKTYQFWLYMLFLLISCSCTGAILTLSDTACYETVQITGSDYGKQRAWGSVGWGLIAPFSGLLNDYTDDYWAGMILVSFLSALQIWNLTKISLVKPQYSKTILKDIKTILGSGEIIAFEIGVFLNGIGIGIVFNFLTWFITDIGGNRLLIGLANSVQCFLGEMPFMFFSGWIINKYGHFNVVSMALFSHAVRFLAYSSLNDPWMILPIEALDGITYGAFYAAMTSYGKKNAKPGTEATTQSVLSSTNALGAGIGCVLGGPCFDYFGGHATFFYLGLCFIGASAINVISTVLLYFRKCATETSEEIPSDYPDTE